MPSLTKTILYIDGMTCANCATRIERQLKGKPGIAGIKASYSAGRAEVLYDGSRISAAEIERLIERLDYRVRYSPKRTEGTANTNQIMGTVIVLFAVYLILQHLGVFALFNAFPEAKAGTGYGMLFVIGLLTSVHCVGMCGGISLTQCVPLRDQVSKSNGSDIAAKWSSLRPSLLYNLGRVLSYTLIGGLVGAIGGFVSFSGAAKGIVQLGAGVFMVIMGLNMLNVFPWLRKLNPRLPGFVSRRIQAGTGGRSGNSPLYVGLLNGLMPCGPLQAMQIYALSAGSAWAGAVSMLLFSLGTVPLMFGFGAVSSLLSRKFTAKIMTASAILVVFLGLFMFRSGMSLSGFAFATPGMTASGTYVAKIDGDTNVQTVTTPLASGRYQPIAVQKGIPVSWTIEAGADRINGCNNRLFIPAYNVQQRLAPGKTVITFTPKESGTIPYSCWMGMIRSQITVVDDLNDYRASANGAES